MNNMLMMLDALPKTVQALQGSITNNFGREALVAKFRRRKGRDCYDSVPTKPITLIINVLRRLSFNEF